MVVTKVKRGPFTPTGFVASPAGWDCVTQGALRPHQGYSQMCFRCPRCASDALPISGHRMS